MIGGIPTGGSEVEREEEKEKRSACVREEKGRGGERKGREGERRKK